MNQQREEYEQMKLLWFWEQSFYEGEDYGFKDDSEYLLWANERREEDLKHQIETAK